MTPRPATVAEARLLVSLGEPLVFGASDVRCAVSAQQLPSGLWMLRKYGISAWNHLRSGAYVAVRWEDAERRRMLTTPQLLELLATATEVTLSPEARP